jgi:uncharacterized protein YlaN (UPF0358 family)
LSLTIPGNAYGSRSLQEAARLGLIGIHAGMQVWLTLEVELVEVPVPEDLPEAFESLGR